MSRDTDRVGVIRCDAGGEWEIDDRVVVEEPLEIRVNGESLVVTMRTPGDDFDLAIGLLFTEGWIEGVEAIGTMSYCADEKEPELRNIVDVRLVNSAPLRPPSRNAWANSSCGLCGKATLESIRQNAQPIERALGVRREVIRRLPQSLAEYQANFKKTGGIHAAGLFDADGERIAVREDIGRHNAVDKVIGSALAGNTLADAAVMMVSGRLGFEIAQKTLMAGVPIVASVSAPSSLAIDLAREFGMAVIGFLRGDSMNIYSHPERIIDR